MHPSHSAHVEARNLIKVSCTLRCEATLLLSRQGRTHEVLEWLTLEKYTARYGLSLGLVMGWLEAGLIPDTDTVFFPEWGGVRLVRDQPYPKG